MDDVAPPSDESALEQLLRERRFGPPEPGAVTPWDFVYRWPDAYLRDDVWPVVSRLLVDHDPLVRARTLEFVRDCDAVRSLSASRLIEVAERQTSLFADQIAEGIPLRRTLAEQLSNVATAGDRTRIGAILRRLAEGGPLPSGAAGILACYDPSFAGAKAREWGTSAVDWIEQAAKSLALYRRDELVAFLESTQQLPAADREQIAADVEEFIKRDDGVAGTLAQRYGYPAPKKPAPSRDDCRRALRL